MRDRSKGERIEMLEEARGCLDNAISNIVVAVKGLPCEERVRRTIIAHLEIMKGRDHE